MVYHNRTLVQSVLLVTMACGPGIFVVMSCASEPLPSRVTRSSQSRGLGDIRVATSHHRETAPIYFVTLAARVLPTAAAPCSSELVSVGPDTATSSHHSRAKRHLLKSSPNLLPICDRPSSHTSYSICNQQHIPTSPLLLWEYHSSQTQSLLDYQ